MGEVVGMDQDLHLSPIAEYPDRIVGLASAVSRFIISLLFDLVYLVLFPAKTT